MNDDQAAPTGTSRDAALRDTGLSAFSDPSMQRFARLVGRVLDVPVALVSLVEADRQVFPGLVGLGEPWSGTRTTPLTHSLCLQVVQSGAPLVLHDTGGDPLWCTHPAVVDLDVAAYAGMPLTDADGHVLGSLCAIDTVPRTWTEGQLTDLADLAAACSAELRLRIVSRRADAVNAVVTEARERADELAERTRDALARSELLLRAAEDLGSTSGLPDVHRRVRELVTSDLKPAHTGLVLREGGELRRLGDDLVERTQERYRLDAPWPTARTVRDNTTIVVQGADELAAGYGEDALAAWTALGLRTMICVPLPGGRVPLGALVIGWSTHHELDLFERAVITALAGYTAGAIERALYLEDRVGVARQLQQAMFTDLPDIDGLGIAALYRPAAVEDLVGGDWYDVYPLPALGGAPPAVAMTIGDITGHDMHAATVMGQVRSMLRQADLDHPGADPAHVISAFEHANRTLGLDASGTLVHAHLRPVADGWEVSWSCAGHLPPLLHLPDGSVDVLDAGDTMVHPGLLQNRVTHRNPLPPGSTLLLYTDGLVERRRRDLDTGIDQVARLLTAQAARPLPDLLHTLADEVAGHDHEDDVALIAVRVPF